MEKLLLVKYASEIFLKGLNRNKFERQLRNNISEKLKGLEYEILNDTGRYFIKVDNIEEGIKRVKKIFGISEICVVNKLELNLDKVKISALDKINEFNINTFKVETNRANKKVQGKSMDISADIGGYILENSDKKLSVDVRNPECKIYLELRENAYIWSTKDKIKGVGGMPYKTNGSTMLMLSGGIDSPVAGYLMSRRGVALNCVYYHSHPYTSEKAKDKVKELAKILSNYTEKVNLYIVPFTEIQMEIINKCNEDELTIIMRRFMMRIACALADKYKIDSVTTGESIGQVASQTMEGLIVSTDCANKPVFRPLIAMDKEDIIEVARTIGTFETSILPYEDCCTIFVPKHPKTRPQVEGIRKSERVLDLEELVNRAIAEIEIVTI